MKGQLGCELVYSYLSLFLSLSFWFLCRWTAIDYWLQNSKVLAKIKIWLSNDVERESEGEERENMVFSWVHDFDNFSCGLGFVLALRESFACLCCLFLFWMGAEGGEAAAVEVLERDGRDNREQLWCSCIQQLHTQKFFLQVKKPCTLKEF